MFTVSVCKNIFKILFEFKKVPELFTFLSSFSAALSPFKLPLKHTKCCLRKSDFSNFLGEDVPPDLSTSSRQRWSPQYKYAPPHTKSWLRAYSVILICGVHSPFISQYEEKTSIPTCCSKNIHK